MLIALISDVHDCTENLSAALTLAEEIGCRHLLFTGDMADMSTFRLMRRNWLHEMDLVLGNNDYPRSDFLYGAREWALTRHHGEQADITLDHRRIYMTHFPHSAMRAAESGLYDAVFYGHTHRAEQHMAGSTLVANPGELQGRYGSPSMAIYDTGENSLIHIRL